MTITLIHNDWPLQSTAKSYFGNPANKGWLAENTVEIPCPWVLHMDQDVLHSILIHKKLEASLTRILGYIWEQAGATQAAIEALHYDRYSGSYNYRPIRGHAGSTLSQHAYAAAIDFDDQENAQFAKKHLFQDDSLIVKAFKAEGWTWGGDWGTDVDAMHFQACKI